MNEYNVIETERLRLTSWQDTEEDAQGLFLWASRPNVGPNAGWKPHASLEESRTILREMFIPGGDGYAIRRKDNPDIGGRYGADTFLPPEKNGNKEHPACH